ncbi:response regulator [[Actinomadura] parvosata]|uniref:response regulator n=1 Tax=[Actinomadura] parvosata TaxID=1955412 RepID=UPI00406C1484
MVEVVPAHLLPAPDPFGGQGTLDPEALGGDGLAVGEGDGAADREGESLLGAGALLDSEPDFTVVAEAGDGAQAVELARESLSDVALLDIKMPLLDGIAAARRIVADAALAAVRVVILANYALDEYVFSALRAGASGFLVKDIERAGGVAVVDIVDVVLDTKGERGRTTGPHPTRVRPGRGCHLATTTGEMTLASPSGPS